MRAAAVRRRPRARGAARRVRRGARASGGRFDPTVGALCVRGGPHSPPRRHAKVRRSWRRARRRSAGDGDGLTRGEDGGVLYERSGGARLDLGGIVKGWVVDQVERLQQLGVEAALVSWGGESRGIGDHPARAPTAVWMEVPRPPELHDVTGGPSASSGVGSSRRCS